jgi:large subunit ribosomal protein L9
MDALAAQNIDVPKRMILLTEPIKELGTYKIPIRVYKGIKPEITLEVEAE